MRFFIAYIFLFIFSFQVLPVKEIGKILFKGQMTEEIHEHEEGCVDGDNCPFKLKKEPDPYHGSRTLSIARIKTIEEKILASIHDAEHLPSYHVPEVLTPPPNC